MKISKETLKRIIAEEMEYQKEATQQQYDPTPGKNPDGSRAPSWTSTEVPDDPKAADKKAWFDLVNARQHTPEQITQIAQQAKADPEKAKSLAGRTASIDGKILVAGSEQLGKLMSAGQFGKEAREIAKNVLQKRSAGQVSRLASYKQTDKRLGGTGKDVDLSAVGAPVGQIRETITKETLKRIINEERERLLAESEQGEYSTEKNYGKGGNAAGPSHPKAGGFGDKTSVPKSPVKGESHTRSVLISTLQKAGLDTQQAIDGAQAILNRRAELADLLAY